MRLWRQTSMALLAAALLAACGPYSPVSGELSKPPASSVPPAPSASAISPPPASSALEVPPPAPPKDFQPLEDGHSSYGRGTLSPSQQEAYDEIADALLSCKETAEISLSSEDELNRVFLCIRRDYPIISWMKSQYSYEQNADNRITAVHLEYTKSASEISDEAAVVWMAGQRLTANLAPELSDFDKSLILYDRLCEAVEYDRAAPRQRELAGALVDGRATCEGYAKAYQYLLSLAGLEALTVYGVTEEPHAWNIVRLEGDYYQADPTFGDVILSDGTVFLSHAYLFLDDGSLSRSHTVYEGEENYPLPACTSMEQNYFVRKGTLLSSSDWPDVAACFLDALNLAVANEYDAAQVRFSSKEVAASCQPYWENGELDRFMIGRGKACGKEVAGRSYDEKTEVLSYLFG